MHLQALESTPVPIDGTWLAWCDGSAFPNPGTMGLGVILTAPDGTPHELSVTAQGRGCNNEAEARAVMAALLHAKSLGASNLKLYSDSRVVIDQLAEAGAGKIDRLDALFEDIKNLLAFFKQVDLVWIPRRRNTGADTLARAAVGLPPKPPARPSKKLRGKKTPPQGMPQTK